VTSLVLKEAATLALLVVTVSVALSLAAFVASQRQSERNAQRGVATFLCFSLYVALLGIVTLAPPPISWSNDQFGTNLVPLLYSVRCFVPNPGQPSTTAFCLQSIVGNLAMFAPLGIMLPLLSEELSSAKSVLTVSMAASISIELLQYVGRWVGNPRWSDVDDVLFNVIGALLGYGFLRLARAAARWLRSPAP